MIGVDGALYKSMEFVGDGIAYLSMDDRFTIANMAIEAGGKNGIFPVDDLTKQYMEEHSKRPYVIYEADEDAEYEQEYTIDLSTLKPTVAFPHLPENTHTIDEVGEIKIDQVVIGSCTNGRMDDLRVAASDSERTARWQRDVRVIVIPATQQIYLQCDGRGFVKDLYRGGCSRSHTYLRTVSGRLYGYPCGTMSDVSPRQTGTLSAEWDTWSLRFIWQVRLWRRQAPSPESYPDRMRLHRRGKETEHESSKGSCI